MGLDDCISDLEGEGYEVQPFIIPACAKNAPHRRDRVWIVGYHDEHRDERQIKEIQRREGTKPTRVNGFIGNPDRFNGDDARHDSGEISQLKKAKVCGLQDAPDTDSEGLEVRPGEQAKRGTIREEWKAVSQAHFNAGEWQENWLEAATRLCRVDDGLPRQVDRVNRLKALGNAIVPQIAFELMKAIMEVQDVSI